ncbi:hypothetical protein CHLRE_01g045752v5 [Chlamydomonas reinhardtii]|uniref:Uncharacterized protein n=1 Tax=Chlamydomonas reinhardtii TaxID=3055 RepID=A0A2K3D073_CHLRE|nr:uncharacterized protein CHLRE_13g579076v5 [Chlamydomonas reinhardtii]XP_042928796.1 uncharacterized protein CHLRE_01g045752v5 [Chlamydomonas reinhardtii]PNW73942.1 hypothetical protein CHLRE_13g579076v5 [Chlamydomonas reinhardtii]PNW88819.1 hypothetical protein CHLRE_01g045752v5 [Chlamydomonas reinhardtii]
MDGIRALMIRPVCRKQWAPRPCFMDNGRHTCPYDTACAPQAMGSAPLLYGQWTAYVPL